MIKKKFIMVILVLASTILFAELPTNKTFRGVPTDVASYLYDQNISVGRSQRLPLTTVTEDTIATSLIFTKRSRIEAIEIFVTDTVESQGDTCYFKLFIGANKILDQKTSAFKLPGFFTFSPLVNWTSSDNSYLYKALANTKSGQTTGITEGNFLVKIKYYIP
jgi:hypothetical protein